MNGARIHEGIRRMRFEDVLGRSERSELSQMEAAELLGISERTFRRWRDRHREHGMVGFSDGRLRPSLRRAPAEEIERMLGLYRELYRGFTVKHFHEQLTRRHNYVLGYTVTKLHLQRAGLVTRASKRSAHRKKRPRRPMVGMLLHQDASTHAWLPGGARHGLFCSLYTDRGSHYVVTPEAGKGPSRTSLTQVGRALQQLGIEHIAAYSPQARGRSERAFSTLQDRLPKELKLAGIETVEAANAWLMQTYIPEHNARFAISSEQEGSAFVVDRAKAWEEILCIQEERVVGNDNTVSWRRLRLQLPPSRLRPHFVRATVRVHEYPDGSIAVFLGPHRLATYDRTGTLIVTEPLRDAA